MVILSTGVDISVYDGISGGRFLLFTYGTGLPGAVGEGDDL